MLSEIHIFSSKSVKNDSGESKTGEEEGGGSRQQWSSSMEFLMSCIAMSVGLGNVWRFPFTAYENGGAAFLIPYLIVLVLIGRPLYLLEVGLGQFCSGGSVKVWRLSPGFKGVGYGQVVASACVASYYCSLIGLSLYYLLASCQATLPWTLCHEDLQQPNKTCVPSNGNKTDFVGLTNTVSSSEQYFYAGVLRAKSDLSDGIGLPDPYLSSCLLLTWAIIFISLSRGVKSIGKLAYFNAIFPYVVMFVLLVKSLTLEGASEGLAKFFLNADWTKLTEPKVWYAAVVQSFFSLSLGFGALMTYSSYNRFRHNTYRDAVIISVADTCTSILAGTIVFAILGHLKHELGVENFDDVVKKGAGLAYISYPEVISKFEVVPQLFSVLFFLMLITLGFGSATGLISCIVSVVCDALPNIPRILVTAIISFLGFLSGLLYVTPGGQALLELVDGGASLLIISLALVEILAIAWVYGGNNVLADLSMMLNTKLGDYWKVCWTVIVPECLIFILFFQLYNYSPVTYNGTTLSISYQALFWIIALAGLVLLAGFSTAEIWKYRREVKRAFQPSSKWGPRDTEDWRDWMNSRRQKILQELDSFDALNTRNGTEMETLVPVIQTRD